MVSSTGLAPAIDLPGSRSAAEIKTQITARNNARRKAFATGRECMLSLPLKSSTARKTHVVAK